MGVYKQMYLMLFNGISKVIEEMKAIQCDEQIVESYLLHFVRFSNTVRNCILTQMKINHCKPLQNML